MDNHLREDVVFYKFHAESKTARKMVKRYPPNKKQRQICDRLHVPHLLWSFFEGKILKHDQYILARQLYPLDVHTIKMPDNFDFGDMKLHDDEKRFISNHETLEKLRLNSVCVQAKPSRLLELCMRAIVKQTGFRGLGEGEWESLLPRKLCIQLSLYKQNMPRKRYQPRPEGKTEIIRYYDVRGIIDLFKEKDEMFSKDFTDWFQNDDSICFDEFKDTHKLILMRFTPDEHGGYLGAIFKCLECMRQDLRGYRIVRYFARTYIIRNVTLLNSIRNRCDYWCDICKRVPLFQILTLQDFCDQYGAETKDIEDEIFF